MASSCTYYVPKFGSTSLCDQNCGVKSADRHTHNTHGQTKKEKLRDLRSCHMISFSLRLWSLAVQQLNYNYEQTRKVSNIISDLLKTNLELFSLIFNHTIEKYIIFY